MGYLENPQSHHWFTSNKNIEHLFLGQPKENGSPTYWVHWVWSLPSQIGACPDPGNAVCLLLNEVRWVWTHLTPSEHNAKSLHCGEKPDTGLTPWECWRTCAMCLSSFQKSTSEEPFNEFPRENGKE